MVRPATLGEQLRAEGVTEERAEVIVQSWSTHARAIVDRLRQYTLADKQVMQRKHYHPILSCNYFHLLIH